jgi:dienelactone hydrolase
LETEKREEAEEDAEEEKNQDDTQEDEEEEGEEQQVKELKEEQQSKTGGQGPAWWNEHKNVPYGKDPSQQIDVYWPKNKNKPEGGWSVVLMLHGKSMKRENFKGFCKDLVVPTGRLCVVGGYRRKDTERVEDTYKLIEWFHKEAKDPNSRVLEVDSNTNVNPENIVLAGYSLGGLNINKVIWDKKMGEKVLGGKSPMVRAVMFFAGVASGHDRQAQKAPNCPESTLIMSSPSDTTVPFKFSKKLSGVLNKKCEGKEVKFVELDEICNHQPFRKECQGTSYEEVKAFLDRCVPGER